MIPEGNVAYLQSAVDGDVNAAYAKAWGNKDDTDTVEAVAQLRKSTGIEPSFAKEYEIMAQGVYHKLLTDLKFDEQEELQKVTGLKIRADKKTINEVYYRQIGNLQFHYQEMLQKRTGVKLKIDKKRITDIYYGFLEKGGFDHQEQVQRHTGVKLKVDKKRVQAMYDAFLKQGKFWECTELKKLTGVDLEISEEQAQEAYAAIVKSEDILHDMDEIGWLKEYTKVEPKVPKEVAHDAYRRLIRSGWVRTEELKKEIGVEEPEYTEEDVQTGYTDILEHHFMGLGTLDKMEKKTGIRMKLDESIVQKAYERAIESDAIVHNNVAEVKRASGIRPKVSRRAVQEEYRTNLRHGNFDYIGKLQKLVGIRLNKTTVQEAYERQFSADHYDLNENIAHAKKIMKFTGVKPNPKLFEKYPEAKRVWYR